MDGAASLADLVHDVLDLIAKRLVLTPAIPLGNVKVHGQRVNLLLPLSNNPVEVLGLLLHLVVEDLGLIQLVELAVPVFNGALSLSEPGLELHLGHLQVLSLGNSFILVLASPLGSLTLGLLAH